MRHAPAISDNATHRTPDIASATEGPSSRWIALLPILVALLTFLAFAPSLRNGFVNWDDEKNLTSNPYYRGFGRDNLHWMFTTLHMGHYQPLAWLTFAVDHHFWGMDARGYHLTALLLHTLNTVLVYFLARKLLRLAMADRRLSAGALSIAAAVAALFFSIHPLRVESVAWATERRDVLSSLFYLLAVLAYVRAHESRLAGRTVWPWFAFALAITAVSFFAKVIAVTLIPVLLAIDLYPLRRLGGKAGWWGPKSRVAWLEKIPIALLSIVFFRVAMSAQSASDMELDFDPAGLASHAYLALFGLSFYLWKTVFPFWLSPLYERPIDVSEINAVYVAAGLVVVAAGVWAWRNRNRRPAWLTVWIAYVAPLAPVLGTYRSWMQCAADRYTYLASIGIAILAGGGLLDVLAPQVPQQASSRRRSMWLAGVLAVLGFLGMRTWQQTAVWSDSIRLWEHVLACEPRSYFGHLHLGKSLMTANRLDEAVARWREAIPIRPTVPLGYINLGVGLKLHGKNDDAKKAFEQALKIDPREPQALTNLGSLLIAENKLDDAIGKLRQAVAAGSKEPGTYSYLGVALQKSGRPGEAADAFAEAIRRRPLDQSLYFYLGGTLAEAGRYGDAANVMRQGLTIGEPQPSLANQLAWLLATCPDDAVRNGTQAVELAEFASRATNPESPEFLDTLAAAYAEAGRFDDAAEALRKAVPLADQADPSLLETLKSHQQLISARRPIRSAK